MQPTTPVLWKPTSGTLEVELGVEYPKYRKIPAVVSRGPDGIVTTRWMLTWRDILGIVINRSIWVQVLTKHQRFPAVSATSFEPDPNQMDSC